MVIPVSVVGRPGGDGMDDEGENMSSPSSGPGTNKSGLEEGEVGERGRGWGWKRRESGKEEEEEDGGGQEGNPRGRGEGRWEVRGTGSKGPCLGAFRTGQHVTDAR